MDVKELIMSIGIYKITSPSGKVYIGQSWDISKRWKSYRNNNAPKQPALNASFLKYGVCQHVFEEIHNLPIDVDQLTMDIYEQTYMDAYNSCSVKLLNTREAGATGKHSTESRDKMKGKLGKWMIGRKLSPETIQKRTEKQTGLKRTETSKQRYSESKTGDKNPFFGKDPWNKGMIGFNKGKNAGSKHGYAKLTEEMVIEIRLRYAAGQKRTHIAKDYGVTFSAIDAIVKRENWKHI